MISKRRLRSFFGGYALLLLLISGPLLYAATAGLPFTEDFQDTLLQDPSPETTANWANGAGAIYLSDGGSVVAIGTTLTDSGNGDEVVLGDVDNDGDLDIVVANNGAENLLYRNDGAGGFNVTWMADSAEVDNTTSVALGDLNGDGFLDIVVGNDGQENKYYINDGSGSFPTTGTAIGSQTDATRGIALADVNGDGDLDVVAGNDGTLNLMYLNDGDGNFPFFAQIGPETDSTQDIILADVNNDLFSDLIVANGSGVSNKIYLNNGVSGFAPASNVGSDFSDTRSIAVGDLDHDGFLDIVAGNRGGANKRYMNNGSGGFAASGIDIDSDLEDTDVIYLMDHNGDGYLDVVAGNGGTTLNRRYMNDGKGSFPASGEQISGSGVDTSSLVAGDLDGDGAHELVEGNASGAPNAIYLNPNGGNFSPVAEGIGSETDNTYGLWLEDIDGDTYRDLIVANTGEVNRIYLNDGVGGLNSTPVTIGPAAVGSEERDTSIAIIAAQLDADSDIDLIVANAHQPHKVYLNQATGGFDYDVAGSAFGTGTPTNAMAAGDVDGDGDIDIVTGDWLLGNQLYTSDGNGVFTLSGAVGSAENTRDVKLVDIGGTSDLDLIVANDGQTNKVYLNNGTGMGVGVARFPTEVALGTEIDASSSIAVGDIDGDSDLDLVFGNSGEPNRYYLNDGSGGFPNPGVAVGTDADATIRVELVDSDLDGTSDYLVAINYQQTSKRYDISGGVISSVGVPISDDTTQQPAISLLGDIDNDNDLDLVVGNYSQTNKLYKNVIYRTDANRVVSTQVNAVSETGIVSARLTASATVNTAASRNTSIDYYLSNNGGGQWHRVRSGLAFIFPNGAGSDLRWKAELRSQSPILTPVLSEIQIEGNRPPDLGDATLAITMGQNQPAVTTVTASDPDNNTLSYSIVGGVDASLFAIDVNSGALSFITAPDFESPADSNLDNIYHVDVQVTDSGPANLTDMQQISITITSVDDSTPTGGGGGGGGALSYWLVALLVSLIPWRRRSTTVLVAKGRALYH